MDALDDISLKREISKFCLKNGVNFTHVGISGNALQVGVITTLKNYKSGKNGSEVRLGNLSYVVSRCASLQVAFAINLNFMAKAKQNSFLRI
ncbi:hypothetical protein NYG85_03500 [Campylobacter sp. PS10]|uniref:Uncharacterized protein n=2 Tax=Campylobacter gastrosuis TaxID=2974576 RepID=A0ABT7HP98_9BACT|nr:hypothetical protein [Campylobacter gastrosuis]MDL0088443.1 hypothetical protein [Campylobacter gastrosuis]